MQCNESVFLSNKIIFLHLVGTITSREIARLRRIIKSTIIIECVLIVFNNIHKCRVLIKRVQKIPDVVEIIDTIKKTPTQTYFPKPLVFYLSFYVCVPQNIIFT